MPVNNVGNGNSAQRANSNQQLRGLAKAQLQYFTNQLGGHLRVIRDQMRMYNSIQLSINQAPSYVRKNRRQARSSRLAQIAGFIQRAQIGASTSRRAISTLMAFLNTPTQQQGQQNQQRNV